MDYSFKIMPKQSKECGVSWKPPSSKWQTPNAGNILWTAGGL